MALIKGKNLADLLISTAKLAADAVTEAKVKLSNNAFLRARNAADSADVNILKVNASDVIEFSSIPQVAGTPSAANDIVNKAYADSLVLTPYSFQNGPYTLTGTDITNQYVDFGFVAVTGSVVASLNGVILTPGVDYTLNYTGGAGGNTRFTFAGDIATGGASEVVASDIIVFFYHV